MSEPSLEDLKPNEELIKSYSDLYKKDKSEFVRNYNAISAVAGMAIPESHVEAVAEHLSSHTWAIAGTKYFEHLALVSGVSYVSAALMYRFGPFSNKLLAAAVTLMGVQVVYIAYLSVVAWLLREGAQMVFESRSAIMRAYIDMVTDNMAFRYKKENKDD